jgi:predicted TIM-barrel fold metal-dependent hydrolase
VAELELALNAAPTNASKEAHIMDLIADRGRRVSIDELNTSVLLAHAAKQARDRKYADMLIVDCDAHHYENENFGEILPFMENEVLKQLALSARMKGRGGVVPGGYGYQDMGGRVTRYPLRSSEKTDKGQIRDVQLGHRWMDAMGVDYSCLLPTGMLNIGLHPQKEMEFELCWAYARWVTEKVLPESDGRFFTLICLPFSDPEGSLRMVETFGGRKGVSGFMVTSVREKMAVYDNAYMKMYRAIEERGLTLAFHSGPNWNSSTFQSCNRFISAHALGFSWFNILHCTNWVINGMGERFPKLPVLWIEAGLAWVPFLMQRLDHEFLMRPSECPLLKKKPSEYMRDMFYSSQPIEIQNMKALETTFEMMNAETQLMYASDYPHWDFDLPSTIHDLPFLSEKAKHNILGGTAARIFKLPPRNEAQKQNLIKYGNYVPA